MLKSVMYIVSGLFNLYEHLRILNFDISTFFAIKLFQLEPSHILIIVEKDFCN